jgi:Holliday junction DNA helicase RuvA
MSVAELHAAVAAQDGARFTKVPGIGKKTAERLLLELKDKLDIGTVMTSAAEGGRSGNDVQNALLALGYNEKEAAWAIRQLAPGATVAEGIRQALRFLSKG